MTIIGTAEVALSPDTTGFEAGLLPKLKGIVEGMSGPLGIVAVGAIAAGAALFDIGEKFEASFRKIRAVTGATDDQMKGLEQSFKNVLASGPDSMSKVADALSMVSVRTKMTGTDLDALTQSELALARVTGSDVKTVVDETTKVFANWGIQGIGPSKLALDELLKISQTTGISVDNLSTTIVGKAGATFREFGVSMSSTATILGTLEAKGVSTQPVIMGLGKVFADAAKHGEDSQTVLANLFATLQKGDTTSKDFADAVKLLGTRGFATLNDAIHSGAITLDEFTGKMADATGTVNRIAEANLSLGDKFAILKNKALVELEPLAIKLVDLVTVLVDKLPGAISKVGDAFSKAWVTVGPTVTQVVADLRVVGGFIGDHLEPILIGLGVALTGAFAPLALLALGFVELYNRSQTFRNMLDALGSALADFARFFTERWEKIRGSLETIFAAIKLIFTVFVAATLGPALLAWQYFGDQIMAVVQLAFDTVGTVLSTFVRVLGDAFDFITSILTGKWGDAWNALADIPMAIIDGWKGMLSNLGGFLVDFFSSLPGNILSALGDLGGLLVGAGTSLVSGLLSAVTSAGGTVASAAAGLAGDIATTVLDVVTGLPGRVIDALAALPGMLADFLPQAWSDAIEGVKLAIAAGITAWVVSIIGVPVLAFTALRELGPKLLDAFKNGIEAVVSALPGLIAAVIQFFSDLPGRVLSAVASFATLFLDLSTQMVHGIIDAGATAFSDVLSWVQGLPGRVLSSAQAFATILLDVSSRMIHGIIEGGASAFVAVIDWILGLPAKVIGAASALAGSLIDVGRRIMEGLKQGMLDVWNQITGWLSSLNPANYKGPPARDAQMLVGAGQLIMGGLQQGMQQGWDATAQWMTGLNPAASMQQVGTKAAAAAAHVATMIARAVATAVKAEQGEQDTLFGIGALDNAAYLKILNERLSMTEEFSVSWFKTWKQIEGINDQVAIDHQKFHDIMFQVGDLSTHDYLAMLQKRLDATTKYSQEWYGIWQQIKQINDKAAADAQTLANQLAATAAATAANVASQWAATYAAQDAAAKLHLEELRNEVKLGMTSATDELKSLLSDQLLNLPQFSNAWMSIRNELMALNNPTSPTTPTPASVPASTGSGTSAAGAAAAANQPISVIVHVDGGGVVSQGHADLIGQRAGAATRRELVSVIHGS